MAESPNVPTEYGDSPDASLVADLPVLDDAAAPFAEEGAEVYDGLESPLLQADSPDPSLPLPVPPPPAGAPTAPPSLPSRPPSSHPPPPPSHLSRQPSQPPVVAGTQLPYNPALHPPKRELPVPAQIPGELVQDPEKHWSLRRHLADLCGTGGTAKFPGSQPVSFDFASLELLEKEDFWVCEKSDGVRVLVLIVATGFGQEVYLIDRKDNIYQNYYLTFPHQDGFEYNHSNTVLDGELVIDVDPKTGAHIPRLLAFDLLVLDSENLMQKPLMKRYGRLGEFVIKPYQKYQKTLPPDVIAQQPFEVVLKKQELSYGIEAVFREHVPKLQHGNDGLIFTSAEAPYSPGTDPKILKWKPPSENSIDFLLQLKFPARTDDGREPDFTAKPVFMLLMNHGHEGNHYYDTMEVDDETWEQWKASKEQYDDRVVEVVWDKARETWKMLRFRDDKFEGNYKTVVASIIRSIQHGVEAEQLVAHAGRIRSAWKRREAARRAPPPPPQNGHGHPHAQQPPHPHQQQGNGHAPPPQQYQQQQQQMQPPPMGAGSGGYGGGGGGRGGGGGGGGLRR
ncbi:hypothetical protein JCM8097_001939 [Rhodosporidiobolus ruineniae]